MNPGKRLKQTGALLLLNMEAIENRCPIAKEMLSTYDLNARHKA
jgi:hypothetical protein